MIITGDIHLDEESAEVVFGQVFPGLTEAAKGPGGGLEIALLGDILDIRYTVLVWILNALRDQFRQWRTEGIHVYVLPGNHDQVNPAGRHALEVFESAPNVYVTTQPTLRGNGLWIPYRKSIAEVIAVLQNPPAPILDHQRVVFAHVGIRGAYMNDHVQDTDGLPLDAIPRGVYRQMIMAHYHKRQEFRRDDGLVARYVGPPRQVTAHEAGQDTGYGVLDDKQQFQWVTTRWGPRFHRIALDVGQGLPTHEFRPGDDVRVTTAIGVDPEAVGRQLIAAGVRHTVTPAVEPMQLRLDVHPNANLRDYATAYVGQTPTDLDRGYLMQVYDTIVQKSEGWKQ